MIIRFVKQLLAKVRGRRGETIAEVLVALLISCLGLLLLASMITATSNIVLKSRKAMDEYYAAGNALSSMTGAEEAEITTAPALLLDGEGNTVDAIAVKEVSYEKSDSEKIVAYKMSDG